MLKKSVPQNTHYAILKRPMVWNQFLAPLFAALHVREASNARVLEEQVSSKWYCPIRLFFPLEMHLNFWTSVAIEDVEADSQQAQVTPTKAEAPYSCSLAVIF